MLVMWGPDLVQVYNDAFRSVLHARHPAGIGQRARDCWPELWEMIGPMYQSVLDTGEAIFVEDQLFRPERKGYVEEAYFTFSYSAIPDESCQPAGIFVTTIETTREVLSRAERERDVQDATGQLRETAASLEVAEARLRHAMEVAATGAWDLDLVGGGSWRALRHDQIFGYPEGRAEWTYDDFLEHVHPDDRAWVDESFGGAVAHNRSWEFTCRIHRAYDGEERWISARGEVVVDEAGRPVRMVGVVRDVTDQQQAEQALREARDAAQAANRTKSEFLAVMSHELRTPLNAIGGYADLLEMGIHGPVTDAQRTALARIQISQKHLLGLINDVLNYAKLETGSVSYDIRPVGVADVLATVEALIAPQARARALTLEVCDCPPDLGVRADREKLLQVLLNLLSNAAKFTDAGGRIVVSYAERGERLYLRVRDTGVGIPADKLASIFEPFVQVRSDLARTADGTGLGLAISRDLARGMGGDLSVESTLGEGSTFTLTLPRAPGDGLAGTGG
jgi:PAS domain S-box-containing protein